MRGPDMGVRCHQVRLMHVLRTLRPILFGALMLPAACMQSADAGGQPGGALPVMRWDHRPEAAQWTQATLDALRSEGAVLASTVPMDVAQYCPDYATAPVADRQAFWAGLFSAIAKYESTWNPGAKGGGGRYLGLLQISPATADMVGCDLGSGGLTDGASNLACAVRIAANRVPDGGDETEGEALAAIVTDWGPMHDSGKRAEVAAWTRAQTYCSSSDG
jgi:Transglycosylase SLT domain